MLWWNKKVATLLSTNTNPAKVGTVQRKQPDGQKKEIPCPSGLISYNQHMKGVDRGNQRCMCMCYVCRTKCRKCYKYQFWFCVDVAITNSLVLHKEVNKTTANTKTFQLQLVDELIGDYQFKNESGRRAVVPFKPIAMMSHYPQRIPDEY